MMKFRKRPVEIEAMRYDGHWTSAGAIQEWAKSHGSNAVVVDNFGNWLDIETPEGRMKVSHGDWVIRGVAGEFYPCKPDIFAATYEAVEE